MTLQEFADLNRTLFNLIDSTSISNELDESAMTLIEYGFKQLSESDQVLVMNFCDCRLADIIFK